VDLPTGLIYIPSPTTVMTNALLKVNMTNRTVVHGVRKVYGGWWRQRILRWGDNR
jgi:hypothetical protein